MPYPYRNFRDWFADEEKLGEAIRISQPIKCGDYNNIVDLGKDIPGKIPETEARALARYLHSLPGKPMALVENPVNNRPDIPVVVNPWPTRERVLRGMGFTDKQAFAQKILDLPNQRIKSRVVEKSKADCKQVVITDVDLRRDISRVWVEFNQCLWSGCNGTWITYDPETGTHGMAKTRVGNFEWENADPTIPSDEDLVKTHGFCTVSRSHRPVQGNAGKWFYERFRARGEPMPCVFVYGLPTDVHVTAAIKSFRWPETGDEYELLGGFRGEPVDVVESETIPGLMVPADAEWVLEGEMLPDDYVTPPFGEDVGMGVMIGDAHWPMFRINCITHRKDPWWSGATFSSNGLNGHLGTHSGLVIAPGEVDAINYLRANGFKIKDVVVLGGITTTIVQLEMDGADKPIEGYGDKVAKTLQGALRLQFGLMGCIVVGPDTNPYDPDDIFWAMVIRGGFMQAIDATQKTPLLEAYVNRMTPKPGMTGDGLLVRTEPVAWEIEAIDRIARKMK